MKESQKIKKEYENLCNDVILAITNLVNKQRVMLNEVDIFEDAEFNEILGVDFGLVIYIDTEGEINNYPIDKLKFEDALEILTIFENYKKLKIIP